MVNIKSFSTVGELKKILQDLPDDRLIISQVVGSEEGAWNMQSEFCKKVQNGEISVITLKHPDLKKLPKIK